ncbi:MAG: Crp/Fnr family transcriptional regulator [Taibaiella sp.]|nr:Crp/Fnr family transcriptional regulator [Taibaiella sp.]
MIQASEDELDNLLADTQVKNFKRKAILNTPQKVPGEVFFINSGLLRVVITDKQGNEHTVHFAMENQFIADYSSFILRQPSIYTLQALEESEVVVLPRKSIEWGYNNLKQGDRLGRLIAEYYFIYHDSRIRDMYERTPKERYDVITENFPGIHNRAPQHMIASYLGITPVHLSRIKQQWTEM